MGCATILSLVVACGLTGGGSFQEVALCLIYGSKNLLQCLLSKLEVKREVLTWAAKYADDDEEDDGTDVGLTTVEQVRRARLRMAGPSIRGADDRPLRRLTGREGRTRICHGKKENTNVGLFTGWMRCPLPHGLVDIINGLHTEGRCPFSNCVPD